MKALNRELHEWFGLVEKGELMLPRFQRFEAWSHQNVTGLLDTILRGLPAGAVLVLNTGEELPFVSRHVSGAPATSGKVDELLLDGQQRITALWRALNGNYERRSYYISLERDEETGRDRYAVSKSRYVKNGELYPLYLNDPTEVWKRRLIPVDILAPSAEAEASEWVERAMTTEDGGIDYKSAMELQKAVSALRGQFAHYNLPYLALPKGTAPETALDVFIKMNTSATPLTTYDIVVAQVEASVEMSLHDMAEMLKESTPNIEAYGTTEDMMLGAAALLQGRPAMRTSFLERGFAEKLVRDFEVIERGMRRAVAFLEAERVFDSKRLPTDVVMPPLIALWGRAPDGGDGEGNARSLLRRFLWRSFFSERYERASNSRVPPDYKAIQTLIEGGDAEPELLDDTAWPLPEPAEFLDAGWPTRKERLARAVLALSLRHGAIDLADDARITRANKDDREYHHLFPKAYLSGKGIAEADRALNCAFVTWRTNRTISSKAPSEYVAERLAGASYGEEEIRRRLQSHLIPYDALVTDRYDHFLETRAEMLKQPMVDLCNGKDIA